MFPGPACGSSPMKNFIRARRSACVRRATSSAARRRCATAHGVARGTWSGWSFPQRPSGRFVCRWWTRSIITRCCRSARMPSRKPSTASIASWPRFHPDNPQTGDSERFLLFNEAYEVLSDPEKRALYDVARRVGECQPLPAFELKEFVDGIEGEQNRRLGVLCLLYNRRRSVLPLVGSMRTVLPG